jgi:hypothetical protein
MVHNDSMHKIINTSLQALFLFTCSKGLFDNMCIFANAESLSIGYLVFSSWHKLLKSRWLSTLFRSVVHFHFFSYRGVCSIVGNIHLVLVPPIITSLYKPKNNTVMAIPGSCRADMIQSVRWLLASQLQLYTFTGIDLENLPFLYYFARPRLGKSISSAFRHTRKPLTQFPAIFLLHCNYVTLMPLCINIYFH